MTKRIVMGAATVVLFGAVLLGHAGCASVQCATASTPPGQTALQLGAEDGNCLQAFSWKPAGDPRAVVLIVHGLRDHAQRYDALAQALTARGLAAYAVDLRGFGHSGGHRQRLDSMDQVLADIDRLAKLARADFPGKKVFVYGHSLGGLIATSYVMQHQAELAGLVLSGPLLVLPSTVSDGEKSAAKLFGTLLPNLPAQALNEDGFVSTPAEKEAFLKDPLVDHDKLPARTARTMLNAIEVLGPHMEELKLPLLVMHATSDLLTWPEGSRELHRRAASADKELVMWDGVFHDLLHEPKREDVLAKVTGWLEARL